MKRWNLSYYAISSCVTAALLAGCGGAQPPIAVPGAMPQNRALAARGDTAKFKVVYTFRGRFDDGTDPNASLVDVGGTLYGTTAAGGSRNAGVVFSVTTGGTEQVLHSFTKAPDGARPHAGMIDVKGTLYGTTYGGGGQWRGTVYSITTSGVEELLHRFEGKGSHGAKPADPLIDIGGTFYGTTTVGGNSGHRTGTVFSVTMDGTEKVLHNFGPFGSGLDGCVPVAPLVDVGGTLYGTTEYCGTYNAGTVFSITTSGAEQVLYSFGYGTDGKNPVTGLIDVDGTLYGTAGGGTYGDGTFYSITTGGSEKVLYNFRGGSDGAGPSGGLIDVNGTLYGTTAQGGGTYNDGTVFSITTSGAEKVVHGFTGGSEGARPHGLLDVAGVLYGTTVSGGRTTRGHCPQTGCGIVFALTP